MKSPIGSPVKLHSLELSQPRYLDECTPVIKQTGRLSFPASAPGQKLTYLNVKVPSINGSKPPRSSASKESFPKRFLSDDNDEVLNKMLIDAKRQMVGRWLSQDPLITGNGVPTKRDLFEDVILQRRTKSTEDDLNKAVATVTVTRNPRDAAEVALIDGRCGETVPDKDWVPTVRKTIKSTQTVSSLTASPPRKITPKELPSIPASSSKPKPAEQARMDTKQTKRRSVTIPSAKSDTCSPGTWRKTMQYFRSAGFLEPVTKKPPTQKKSEVSPKSKEPGEKVTALSRLPLKAKNRFLQKSADPTPRLGVEKAKEKHYNELKVKEFIKKKKVLRMNEQKRALADKLAREEKKKSNLQVLQKTAQELAKVTPPYKKRFKSKLSSVPPPEIPDFSEYNVVKVVKIAEGETDNNRALVTKVSESVDPTECHLSLECSIPVDGLELPPQPSPNENISKESHKDDNVLLPDSCKVTDGEDLVTLDPEPLSTSPSVQTLVKEGQSHQNPTSPDRNNILLLSGEKLHSDLHLLNMVTSKAAISESYSASPEPSLSTVGFTGHKASSHAKPALSPQKVKIRRICFLAESLDAKIDDEAMKIEAALNQKVVKEDSPVKPARPSSLNLQGSHGGGKSDLLTKMDNVDLRNGRLAGGMDLFYKRDKDVREVSPGVTSPPGRDKEQDAESERLSAASSVETEFTIHRYLSFNESGHGVSQSAREKYQDSSGLNYSDRRMPSLPKLDFSGIVTPREGSTSTSPLNLTPDSSFGPLSLSSAENRRKDGVDQRKAEPVSLMSSHNNTGDSDISEGPLSPLHVPREMFPFDYYDSDRKLSSQPISSSVLSRSGNHTDGSVSEGLLSREALERALKDHDRASKSPSDTQYLSGGSERVEFNTLAEMTASPALQPDYLSRPAKSDITPYPRQISVPSYRSLPGSPISNQSESSPFLTSGLSRITEDFTQSADALRFGPETLHMKFQTEMAYLESLEESSRQIAAMERIKAVSLAQADSLSVAQLLQSRTNQLMYEEELARKEKAEQEKNFEKQILNDRSRFEKSLEGVKKDIQRIQEEASRIINDSTLRLNAVQAESTKVATDAAQKLVMFQVADTQRITNETTAAAAATAAVRCVMDELKLQNVTKRSRSVQVADIFWDKRSSLREKPGDPRKPESPKQEASVSKTGPDSSVETSASAALVISESSSPGMVQTDHSEVIDSGPKSMPSVDQLSSRNYKADVNKRSDKVKDRGEAAPSKEVSPFESHKRRAFKHRPRNTVPETSSEDYSDWSATLYTPQSCHPKFAVFPKSSAGPQLNLTLLKQSLKEADLRAKHQQSLLKLREIAVGEEAKAKLAWLMVQKNNFREKGREDRVSYLKKKERSLQLRLQLQKNELARLRHEANLEAMKEKQRLLAQYKQIDSVEKQGALSDELLKTSASSTPEYSTFEEEVLSTPEERKDPPVSDNEGLGLERRTTWQHRKARPTEKTSLQGLKKTELDEKHLIRREKELTKRKLSIEKRLLWKKRLDEEEQALARMEEQVKKTGQVSPQKVVREEDMRSSSMCLEHNEESENQSVPEEVKSIVESVCEDIITENKDSNVTTSSNIVKTCSEQLPYSNESFESLDEASDVAQKPQKDTYDTVSREGSLVGPIGRHSNTSSCQSRTKPLTSKLDRSKLVLRLNKRTPGPRGPTSDSIRRTHSSCSEDSLSMSQNETGSDVSDIEGRVLALQEELDKRKKEAEFYRKETKKKKREKLKFEEQSLKILLGVYDQLIKQTKEELEYAKHDTSILVKPHIRRVEKSRPLSGPPALCGHNITSSQEDFKPSEPNLMGKILSSSIESGPSESDLGDRRQAAGYRDVVDTEAGSASGMESTVTERIDGEDKGTVIDTAASIESVPSEVLSSQSEGSMQKFKSSLTFSGEDVPSEDLIPSETSKKEKEFDEKTRREGIIKIEKAQFFSMVKLIQDDEPLDEGTGVEKVVSSPPQDMAIDEDISASTSSSAVINSLALTGPNEVRTSPLPSELHVPDTALGEDLLAIDTSPLAGETLVTNQDIATTKENGEDRPGLDRLLVKRDHEPKVEGEEKGRAENEKEEEDIDVSSEPLKSISETSEVIFVFDDVSPERHGRGDDSSQSSVCLVPVEEKAAAEQASLDSSKQTREDTQSYSDDFLSSRATSLDLSGSNVQSLDSRVSCISEVDVGKPVSEPTKDLKDRIVDKIMCTLIVDSIEAMGQDKLKDRLCHSKIKKDDNQHRNESISRGIEEKNLHINDEDGMFHRKEDEDIHPVGIEEDNDQGEKKEDTQPSKQKRGVYSPRSSHEDELKCDSVVTQITNHCVEDAVQNWQDCRKMLSVDSGAYGSNHNITQKISDIVKNRNDQDLTEKHVPAKVVTSPITFDLHDGGVGSGQTTSFSGVSLDLSLEDDEDDDISWDNDPGCFEDFDIRQDEEEYLRRKQEKIDREIQELEALNRLSDSEEVALYLRSIPNKPPPPYTPPKDETVVPIVPSSLEDITSLSHDAMQYLMEQWQDNPSVMLENLSPPAAYLEDTKYVCDSLEHESVVMFKRLVFDLCRSFILEKKKFYLEQQILRSLSKPIVSMEQAPPISQMKRWTDLVFQEVQVMFRFKSRVQNPTLVSKWIASKNAIYDVLVDELQQENLEWNNMEKNEVVIKFHISDVILHSLLRDTAAVFQGILDRRKLR